MIMMKCPLCSSSSTDSALECPSCGAIYAKLRARAEKLKNGEFPALTPSRGPAPVLWRVRVASLAVVAGWMIGLGIYYRVELARSPRRVRAVAMEGRLAAPARGANGLIGAASEVPKPSGE